MSSRCPMEATVPLAAPSKCLRFLTYQAISEAVMHHKNVQETIRLSRQTLQEIRQEFGKLLSRPELKKIWAKYLAHSSSPASPSTPDPSPSSSCVDKDTCTVLVCGLVKAGKSSLINEFLRDLVNLPEDEGPCTIRFTVVKYGEANCIKKVNAKGEAVQTVYFEGNEIPCMEFMAGEDGTDIRQREDLTLLSEHALVELNCDLLRSGLRIIDTPGLNENPHLDTTFYNMVKGFRPTLVIFVFDSRIGLGVDVVQFCDRLLKTLNTLKYPYSVMLVANKIDEDNEALIRDLQPPSELGYKFNRDNILSIVKHHFPHLMEQLTLHPASSLMLKYHRFAVEDVTGEHDVLRFHFNFEMDIAKKIHEASMNFLQSSVKEVEPLMRDFEELIENSLTSASVSHQERMRKRLRVTTEKFPEKLSALHTKLTHRAQCLFQANWDPFVYQGDLFSVLKKTEGAALSEDKIRNLVEFLVDRAANVLSENLIQTFTDMRFHCEQYSRLSKEHLPVTSLSHEDCMLESEVVEERSTRIREECTRLLNLWIQEKQLAVLPVEKFIPQLCNVSQHLPQAMGRYFNRRVSEEETIIGEGIAAWVQAAALDEDLLNFSMSMLNSLMNKSVVVNLALTYAKEPIPKVLGWDAMYACRVHFLTVGLGHKWLQHLSYMHAKKNSLRLPPQFHLSHACALHYDEEVPATATETQDEAAETSCTIILYWNVPSAAVQLVNSLDAFQYEQRREISLRLWRAVKENRENPVFAHFCIHTLSCILPTTPANSNGVPEPLSLIYNPYFPPLEEVQVENVAHGETQSLVHDCLAIKSLKRRLLSAFLHLVHGVSCPTSRTDAILNHISVSEALSGIFRDSPREAQQDRPLWQMFSEMLMLPN